MPEIRSPITPQIQPGDYGTSSEQGVTLTLSEYAPGVLFQIAGWDDFAKATAPALTPLGFDGPGNYRTVRTAGLACCLRIAPDKLLLRHQDRSVLSASLEKLDPARSPTLDLSHARWIIDVEGSAAEALLARLAAIDFSLSKFPESSFVQTGIHHVGVMLHRVSVEKFEIYVPVTWARSLWDFICEAATPLGYRVKTDRS